MTDKEKKELPKLKFLILIPMESAVLYDSFVSFTNLFMYLKDNNVDFLLYSISGSAHAFARNTLFDRALEAIKREKDFTHVIWMDSDHVFNPEDVIELLRQKEQFKSDIMGAGYLTKHVPIGLVALKAAGYRMDMPDVPYKFHMIQHFELNKVYDVDAVGFGMVAMKPEVLLAMEKAFGKLVFEFPLVEDIVQGEDVSFCTKAKMLGYKIDVTTGVMLGHITSMVMTPETALKMHGIDVHNNKPSEKMVEGWLSDNEAIILRDLAKDSKPGVIVEIGSWKGLSTTAIANGSKEGLGNKVYAVDPHKGSPEHVKMFKDEVNTYEAFMKNITDAGVKDIITPMVMTSEKAAGFVTDPVSLLFIDGNHSEEMVQLDFYLWNERVVKGGIIAFHDNNFPGPMKLIDYLNKNAATLGLKNAGTIDSITWFEKV